MSLLNAAAPTLLLEDADGDGVYEGTVPVTTADAAADADIEIAITAADDAGNTAEPKSVTVTLDNTAPVITGEDIDMPSVMMGGMATISATLSEDATVSADVSDAECRGTDASLGGRRWRWRIRWRIRRQGHGHRGG